MIEYLSNPVFWIGLGQIIVVNIVLSGDNAVVIALAARSLPAHQQKQAILWGSVAAIIMRVILTIVAVEMLKLPYLKLVGALLLFWIAVQLLAPEDDAGDGVESVGNLWAAIRTILIADLVMSLDNVIGVAAAAKGDNILLILGLAISIPLIIFGSTIILKLMDRYPIIITGGAALLGWVAGEMLITDPVLVGWIAANMPWMHIHLPLVGEISWAQIAGAAIVILAGKVMVARGAGAEKPVVDLAPATKRLDSGVVKLLMLADGSENSLRCVRHVVSLGARYRQSPELVLLNVQHPLPGTVRGVQSEAAKHHQEEGLKALAGARKALDEAGVPYTPHVAVGDVPDVIARFARDQHVDEIVMGCRGASATANLLLGSVATKVLQLAEVPVLLVK